MRNLRRLAAASLALAILALAAAAAAPALPLRLVEDVTLGPPTRRVDYTSLDPTRGLLFLADLAGSRVLAFDVKAGRLKGAASGVAAVHGVLAVPDLGRVYASATGTRQLVAIDEQSPSVVARTPAGRYPDGVAWDPRERKLYVSDEEGDAVAVIDAGRHELLRFIPMNGEVGNTQYDAASGLIYSNAEGRDELVGIDPKTDKVVWRDQLAKCRGNHGLLIDAPRRLAFIACESNDRLIMLSLATHARLADASVGEDPDVLAYDPGLRRLYVASESGVVTIFQVTGRSLAKLGQAFLADNAHTVAVDPATHLVYFPLRNVDGRAVLRVMAPK